MRGAARARREILIFPVCIENANRDEKDLFFRVKVNTMMRLIFSFFFLRCDRFHVITVSNNLFLLLDNSHTTQILLRNNLIDILQSQAIGPSKRTLAFLNLQPTTSLNDSSILCPDNCHDSHPDHFVCFHSCCGC